MRSILPDHQHFLLRFILLIIISQLTLNIQCKDNYLLLLASERKALVICTLEREFLGANASFLGKKTMSSMFMTMKFWAVSFKVLSEQTSEISRTFDEFKEASICRSQNSRKYGISYLSDARNNVLTCFSIFSEAKLPL